MRRRNRNRGILSGGACFVIGVAEHLPWRASDDGVDIARIYCWPEIHLKACVISALFF